MKTLFLFCILSSNLIFSQNLNWSWAKSFGGPHMDKPHSITADSLGNTYMTGLIFDTVNFGPYQISSDNKNTSFIAKISSLGKVQWVKKIGNSFTMTNYQVSVGKNLIFLAGYLSDTVRFDNELLGVPHEYSAFLMALDLDGNLIWKKAIDRTSNIKLTSNKLDEFAISVSFTNYTSIDSSTYTSTSQNSDMVFFGNKEGNIVWNRIFESTNTYGSIWRLTLHENRLAVMGKFRDSIYIDSNFIHSTLESGMFVSVLDKSGNSIFTKTASSPLFCASSDACFDENKNIYVSGGYSETGEFDGQVIPSNPNGTTFIAKYDSLGLLKWLKHGNDVPNGGARIKKDNEGNVYITGGFFMELAFDDFSIVAYPSATANMFLLKISAEGEVKWLKNCVKTQYGWNFLADMTMNGDDLFLTGYISGDPVYFGTHGVQSVGSDDIFIAKLDLTNAIDTNTYKQIETTIYPNPFNKQILINTSVYLASQISLINCTGEIVFQMKPENTFINLNIPNLSNGMYFIKIEYGSRNEFFKIIKI